MQQIYKIALLLLIGFSTQAQEVLTLEDALKLGTFDYLYFAGHGDETCFTDNKLLNLTWTEIGELICQTRCLNNNAIVMLYCCKGGLSPVVFISAKPM